MGAVGGVNSNPGARDPLCSSLVECDHLAIDRLSKYTEPPCIGLPTKCRLVGCKLQVGADVKTIIKKGCVRLGPKAKVGSPNASPSALPSARSGQRQARSHQAGLSDWYSQNVACPAISDYGATAPA